jgi:hypothetical protein
MAQTTAACCTACNGTGQVQTTVENSATGQSQTLTETCLDCL